MRVGIMGSPELLPKPSMKSKKLRKGTSFESMPEPAYNGSVSSNGRTVDEEEPRSGVVLPGWSAGWGVQSKGERGRDGNGRVESIMLNDVGRLLK